MKDGLKSEDITDYSRSVCMDAVVKSLNENIESLESENGRLKNVQEELQKKLKETNEEKRILLLSEQNLKQDVNKK